ncbi:MAG: pitrilysin family protein [Bacteroidota bacterium]|nr:pitrilysin family protein [Bacteroidota bacterium]
MKHISLVVLLATLLFLPAFGQDFVPIQFEEYKLSNGLTVILHVDRTAPTAMTYIVYRVGSKDEVPGRTGFAHFFEHLMFEGSAHIGRGEVDKLISAAGGINNASTSNDRTDYFFKVPANQLELALWIESDRLLSLNIDSLGIETQRKVVKEELKQRYEGKPYATLQENLFRQTFAGTPYEWTPIGNPDDINRATRKEFLAFHRKYYLPNNACLAVGGDIDVEQTKRWIEKYFGPIPAGPPPPRAAVKITEPTQETFLRVEEKTTPLPALIESYLTVDQRHPDAYALEFLGAALSTGRSSRLYRRLVDQDQTAIMAGSFPFTLDQAGMFAFFVIANRGVDIETIRKAVHEEIERIQKEGISDEEFRKLRNTKETEFIRGLTRLDGKLSSLAYYALFHGNANLVNEEFQRFMAVTADDVRRVAATYLRPNRRNTIIYPVPENPSR